MKKILIVDDDQDILDVVTIILTSRGYEVYTHTTGFNVPETITKFAPDLVLLDIMLPGKLGTQICRELREISDLPPIVLFSAHAKKGDADACKANAFILKAFDSKNLVETINRHVA